MGQRPKVASHTCALRRRSSIIRVQIAWKRIAQLHARIADCRKEHHHRVATRIVCEHTVRIPVETDHPFQGDPFHRGASNQPLLRARGVCLSASDPEELPRAAVDLLRRPPRDPAPRTAASNTAIWSIPTFSSFPSRSPSAVSNRCALKAARWTAFGCTPNVRYTQVTSGPNRGRPAGQEIPAPQKNTTRPSSWACNRCSGMSGPPLTNCVVRYLYCRSGRSRVCAAVGSNRDGQLCGPSIRMWWRERRGGGSIPCRRFAPPDLRTPCTHERPSILAPQRHPPRGAVRTGP